MRALILAGGRPRGGLATVASVPWEALIPIAGRPMVSFVIEAVAEAPPVQAVRVVGPPVPERHGVEFVEPGAGSLWESLGRGLAGWPEDEPVLIATADIPLVTPAIIERVVVQSPPREVVYTVVPREATERRFPGVRRTYLRFQEGAFTGGNVFVARPGPILRARAHAERLIAHRKQPWRLAGDIGLGTLIRFLLRRLTLRDAERLGGRLLAIDGAALVSQDPEVGVDVDKPSDLELVTRVLAAAPEGAAGHV